MEIGFARPLQDLEKIDLHFLGINVGLVLLEDPGHMLPEIVGLECGDDSLKEGLAHRSEVGWKEEDENMFVLKSTKTTFVSTFIDFFFW